MNYYEQKRRSALQYFLQPSLDADEAIDLLCEYVEEEVTKAYRRGLNAGRTPRPTRDTRFDIYGKPSAMKAGKLPRANQREAEPQEAFTAEEATLE
jgi:hypothetical protein